MSPSAVRTPLLTLAVVTAALGCASNRPRPATPRAAAPRPADPGAVTPAAGSPGAAAVRPSDRNGAPAPLLVREERDVVYGTAGGESLKLDLYAPVQPAGPWPAMVFIHTGGWCGGAKEEYGKQARALAERGYVTITVNYRLAPRHRFPAPLEDVKCAVRWLRANAARYQVDSECIGATGGSAGGYLALLLGFTEPSDGFEGQGGNPEQSSKVRAVINVAGPTDLTWRNWPGATEVAIVSLMGGSRTTIPAAYKAASPMSYLRPDAPPVLTIHGTTDNIVPFEQAEHLHAALAKAGVSSRLEFLSGKGHFFDWTPEDWQFTEALVRDFADRHLKRSGTVTGQRP
jgi:acetyl esterase/lipase